MKKFFTMALMSLVFMACNKKENKETPKEETHPIEGTWYLESSILDGEVDNLNDCDRKSFCNFSKGNYKVENYRTQRDGSCKLFDGEATYSVSENKLTIKFSEGGEKTNIFSINNDILTINGENSSGIPLIQTWKKR